MSLDLNGFQSQILASPILIVDDDAINRIFIEKALQSRGFTELLSVASGEEAFGKLEKFAPDIVLLDILMPGMNGYECCKKIRSLERYRDLPVLMQTTITEPGLRVKAFEQGATDFVSKPIYADELCARVTVHLQKRHSLKTLQAYKKNMQAELDSARELQEAILPGLEEIETMKRRCRLDIASHFQTSSEIGGDFWGMRGVFPSQTAFWLVDFSGHGVAAALNAFRLQAYLKEHSPLAARPGEYLSFLNDKLLQLLLRGQFATMFYGIVDILSNQLFYACACAPHPIILRRATGKAEWIDGTGNPLGIGMHLYPTQSVPFVSGDMLLLYSDALTETANADGEFISEQQIIQLMEEHEGVSAKEFKEILLSHFRQHAGSRMRDDLTIAICSRSNV